MQKMQDPSSRMPIYAESEHLQVVLLLLKDEQYQD